MFCYNLSLDKLVSKSHEKGAKNEKGAKKERQGSKKVEGGPQAVSTLEPISLNIIPGYSF